MAWAGLAAWLGGGHRHEEEECGLFRLMAEVREVGARYFEHRDAATGDGLVGMGVRVVFCLDIVGGVQEESTGLVDASVV